MPIMWGWGSLMPCYGVTHANHVGLGVTHANHVGLGGTHANHVGLGAAMPVRFETHTNNSLACVCPTMLYPRSPKALEGAGEEQ